MVGNRESAEKFSPSYSCAGRIHGCGGALCARTLTGEASLYVRRYWQARLRHDGWRRRATSVLARGKWYGRSRASYSADPGHAQDLRIWCPGQRLLSPLLRFILLDGGCESSVSSEGAIAHTSPIRRHFLPDSYES